MAELRRMGIDIGSTTVKVVIMHIPPKSNGWHGQAEITRLFAPILNSADIDVMFCGHIHKYQFSEPNDPLTKCNFPVVCNPNRARMDVEVTAEKITYNIVNSEGEKIINNELLIK